jgi:hypothetical protein
MLFCQSNKGVSAQLHILFLFSPKSEANILNRFGNCSRKSRIGDTDQISDATYPLKRSKLKLFLPVIQMQCCVYDMFWGFLEAPPVSCGYAMRRMENAQIARIRAGMGPT